MSTYRLTISEKALLVSRIMGRKYHLIYQRVGSGVDLVFCAIMEKVRNLILHKLMIMLGF